MRDKDDTGTAGYGEAVRRRGEITGEAQHPEFSPEYRKVQRSAIYLHINNLKQTLLEALTSF